MTSQIYIYADQTVDNIIEVQLIDQTLWLSLNQIAELFKRDKSVIAKHLKNIFKEQELVKSTVVAKIATTAKDDKIYQVEHFNLDAIISVGYRVNSKQGTSFRKWASKILTDYLVKGYSLNARLLAQQSIQELQQITELFKKASQHNEHSILNNTEVINIINEYAKSWSLLLQYDENKFETPISSLDIVDMYSYEYAVNEIALFTANLRQKGEATKYFGREKDNKLIAILASLNQTYASHPLYTNNIERAANLLYLIIKDHPFIDGNKRIGCFLFILYFSKIGNYKKCSNNTLTMLGLLVAESKPAQKDLIIKLIMNLII